MAITPASTSPIFYIDEEELNKIKNDGIKSVTGIAYEWEGENVFHLHLSPLPHSFGKPHIALFEAENKALEATADDDVIRIILSESSSPYVVFNGKSYEVCLIPSKENLYSRNKGILELNILENKRVLIIGLGSFGSQIAIELAKAGVGHFALMDFDRVELHNLARHTSTTNDLGRLKTDVINDAIKGKNPYATVEKFPIDINYHKDLLIEQCALADIVICATDNNRSRFILSDALYQTQTIGIFGRAITRAEGGDVFIYRPGGPCYCCLIGNDWFDAAMEEITNEESARREGRIAAYVSAKDADAMVQVGLSADIEPMCNMMTKLALMELSRGTDSGIKSLEEEFVDSYYIWVNRRERKYSNWASFANPGQLPTIMRWYGVDVPRNNDCALCGNTMSLDTGEAFVDQFGEAADFTKYATPDFDIDALNKSEK